MSWHPNDLVSDADLLAYEQDVLKAFAQTDWTPKRTKAIEDWMFPILRAQGVNVEQFRTRYEATQVYGFTGGVYTDLTTASQSQTADDLNLATVFATPGSDALYVGFRTAFRGLSVRMLAGVSAVAGTVTVSYWGDTWTPLAVTDGTSKVAGKPFSGGGGMTWGLPSDWVKRTINGSTFQYWVKVTVTATPTAGTACQIGTIRRSLLCAPLTFRTLALIMREAPTTNGVGPWTDKALWYETEADASLQRALGLIAGEFDTDDSDLISEDESEQSGAGADGSSGGGFRMERH